MKNEIVYRSEKGTPVTDSQKVANSFGKQHRNVLQSIRNLIGCAENSAVQKWFYESTYLDAQGKTQPMFVMNRDGFSLLAMGLTGTKAMQFKVAYIQQFDAMETIIKNAPAHPAIPQSFSEALRLAASQQEKIELQEKQLQEQAPRVLFSQAVETSRQSILIGELSKILRQRGVDIGEKRLFQWLRDKHYLCAFGERYNQPTQYAMDMALFELKKTPIMKPNGETIVSTTTKVTGKGQIYFVNKFLFNQKKSKSI